MQQKTNKKKNAELIFKKLPRIANGTERNLVSKTVKNLEII